MSSPRNISFETFLEHMKNPQAKSLVNMMHARIKLFRSTIKGSGTVQEIEDKSKAFQVFIQDIETQFAIHPIWKDKGADELEVAIEGCEKFMLSRLHDIFFGTCNEDKMRDRAISERLEGLQFVTLQHFELPEWIEHEKIEQACQEINNINNYKAPRDKLVCVTNVCRRINNILQERPQQDQDGTATKSAQGADVFVPLFLYTFVKSNAKQMVSNIEYIKRFRNHNRYSGEIGWASTQLEAAVNWVETITHDKLKMDKDEFIARMLSAGVTEVEAQVLKQEDINELQQQRQVQQQQNQELEKQIQQHPKNHIDQAKNSDLTQRQLLQSQTQGAQSDNYQKEISRLTQQLQNLQTTNNQLQIRLRQVEDGILKTNLLDSKQLQLHGEQILSNSPTIYEDIKKQYPYFYAQTQDIKLGDLPKMLEQYKDMAIQQMAMEKGIAGFQQNFKSQMQKNIQNTQHIEVSQQPQNQSTTLQANHQPQPQNQNQEPEDQDVLTSKQYPKYQASAAIQKDQKQYDSSTIDNSTIQQSPNNTNSQVQVNIEKDSQSKDISQ